MVRGLIVLSLIAAQAFAQQPTYRIAYNVLHNKETDDYEIFIMNLDGTGKKNISNWKGVDWVYYAYGDKLYFISDRDSTYRKYHLYEMDADGKNVRKISKFLVDDSWFGSRKNATEFIVRPYNRPERFFALIDREGNVLREYLKDTLRKNDPLFSPDGKEILFRMKKGKFDELWMMDEYGGKLRQLTHYPEDDTTAPWHAYHAGPPRWNVTENFITYQSMRDHDYHLYAITPDGKKNWRLTNNDLNEGWHDWSPDGKWLAIEMFDREQTQFDIYLMDWKTKSLQRLTDEKVTHEQAPVFVKTR